MVSQILLEVLEMNDSRLSYMVLILILDARLTSRCSRPLNTRNEGDK